MSAVGGQPDPIPEAGSRRDLGSIAICLPKQLRQPRDVDGDASRLILREHLGLPRLVFVVAGLEVGERLPIGVPDDVAAGHLVGAPGRREAA
jgi:hypothetical protein